MKKLVTESLQEFLNEEFDPTYRGTFEGALPDPNVIEDEDEVEETEFTAEQKKAIEAFVSEYQGDFEDEDVHNLADEMGLEHGEVEEYIYNMAREETNEPEETKTPEDGSTKKGFHDNIEESTLDNEDFRRVLYTGENLQLVLMTLQPGEDIGEETHDNDQFFRFEEGSGIVVINENEYDVEDGSAIIVPAGSKHNIINTGEEDLKLYTLYSPPHHKDGIEYKTKEEAEESTENFDGKTTE